jgi:hypothetical protein
MRPIQGRLLVLAASAALVFGAAPEARAEKKYNLASLTGAYHFTLVEIQVTSEPEPETIYCNGYGRIVFDGAGSAETTTLYVVCSNGETMTFTQEFTYTVEPDGTVFLSEQGDVMAHCQIADKGALFLCDGSGGIGGSVPPERPLWMVTAAKL